MKISNEMLDVLLKDCKNQEDLFGANGVIKSLVKAMTERMLNAEMDEHLGHKRYDFSTPKKDNYRNGTTKKTIKGDQGETDLEIPRDRNGTFEPKLVPKYETRINQFDDKIISLYARGMTTRDIQDQIKDLYGVEISPTLVSNITDSVLAEATEWQNRALDRIYPIVYLDGLVVKIKENRQVINKTIYFALGINCDGHKELLGMWVHQTEGAKFWLHVLTELQNRGVKDIFIACIDGLKGFPEAIEAVFPKTKIQLCIVHQIRNSLKFVDYKKRKEIAKDLKTIYGASTCEGAESALIAFSDKWDAHYPAISKKWTENWTYLSTFFAYPSEIRKVIYTTNTIESLNSTMRKIIKNKKSFPSDAAALKQIYLGLKNIMDRWTMPVQNWGQAMSRFDIEFSERLAVR